MTAPAGITISCLSNLPTSSTLSFTNGLGGGCLINGTSNTSTFSTSPACNGTITETWTATDVCGRTLAPVSRVITITYSGGLTAPTNTTATVSCPANATDPGAPANITDACGRTVSATLVGSTSTPATLTCNGSVVWRYRYTACDGTTTADWTKTYTVTYSGGLIPPANGSSTVSCPAQAVNPGAPANIVDGCGRTVSAVLVGSTTPPVCNGSVVWTYRYTACDGTTTADWTYTYTINRTNTPPTISGCPSNITKYSNSGNPLSCSQIVTWTAPTAVNNCGGATNVSSTHNPGNVFPLGTTTVTYTFTDCVGNSSTCLFTVTVVDNTAPSITCGPSYTSAFNPAVCGLDYTIPNTTISDNCTTVSQTWTITRNSIVEASGSGNVPSRTYGIGTSTIVYLVTDGSGNTNTCSTTVTVTALSVTPVFTINPTSQQYSDKVEFKVVIPNGVSTCGNAATSATFTVTNGGSQIMGTANFVANGSNLEAILNAALFENPASTVMAPGNKTASFVLNGVNNSIYSVGAASPATRTLTITKEDARINFTGTQLAATISASSSIANIILRATVQDITATPDAAGDADFGDIRKAKVRFRKDGAIIVNGGTDANGWVLSGISLVNPADIKTGIVSLDWQVDIGAANAVDYTISMEIDGYYTRYSSTDNTVITVYKPIGDFITGGGHIIPTQSAGQYAADAGKKTNFGFNVKYNKTGNNLQGNMNIIFRRTVSGVVRAYQVKSNSMTSLGVNIANPNAMTAVFVSKCNLKDITDPLLPISLGGNLTLQVNMTDRGEPGVNDDIAISLYDGSVLLYSSNWTGNSTALMLLAGGNLVVHSGFSVNNAQTANPIISNIPAIGVEQQTIGFNVLAYPNPSASQFSLILQGGNNEKVQIIVYDVAGKPIKTFERSDIKQQIRFGEDLRPGIYLAEITQGNNRRTIKLVKQ